MVNVMVRVLGVGLGGCGFALRFGLRVEIRELQDANFTFSTLNGLMVGDNGLRVGIEGGRQNGLRVATDQTGGRRQTVLETLQIGRASCRERVW